MNSDWEQYLEKQDRKAKLARRIFYWGIFCVLIVMIILEIPALIPEPEPIPPISNEDIIIFNTDSAIQITTTTAIDAIFLTSSSGGIDITFDADSDYITFENPNK